MIRSPRTMAALTLVTAAIAIPAASWYRAGMAEARRETERAQVWSLWQARELGARLSDHLARRLEELRAAESTRPWHHYQNLHHDPAGASEGASVTPSPLSETPDDPLVLTWFQVQADGRVTLPQHNEDIPALNRGPADAARQMREALQAAAPLLRAELDRHERPSAGRDDVVEVVEGPAWEQNVFANALFVELKQPQGSSRRQLVIQSRPPVEVRVGELRWVVVPVRGQPTLVGARNVTTPAGAVVQGLQVSTQGMEALMEATPLPVRIERKARRSPLAANEVAVPLGRLDLRVVVDASAGLESARVEQEFAQRSFKKTFATLLGLATLAGGLVIGVVWQAERLARERTAFAAIAAHELRTPLAGIRLNAGMLAEGLGDPDRVREYARRAAHEAERLGRVVSNVLGLSRLERGTLAIDARPGDLAALVRERVEGQRSALESAGATVDVRVETPLSAGVFDPDATAHVLANLLDNAEKHGRGAPDRRVSVDVAERGGLLVLTVRDHGPGLPREVARRPFRAFRRTGSSSSGLGVGLALSRALARAQGGDLVARNERDGGASFELTVPRAA